MAKRVLRPSLISDIDPKSELGRQNGYGQSAFRRSKLSSAPPLTNMPVEIAIANAWTGTVDTVYFKRLSVSRDKFDVMLVNASTGTVSGRTGIGIYRIDTQAGLGTYSGLVVPRLVKVWSYSSLTPGSSDTYAVGINPPNAIDTPSFLTASDRRADVTLLPTEDYVSAVAVSAAAGGTYNGAIGAQSIVQYTMASGWTDLPEAVEYNSLVFTSFVPQFVQVVCRESSIFALW